MMDDLSMITVGPQLNGRGLRLDCTACVGVEWTSYMAGAPYAPMRRTLSDLVEVAQRHVREAHTDAMARARLANGGRGEVNAAPGKFARAADVVKVRDLDMTDAELAEFKARLRASITDGAVFTQRDVDPLGRGVGGDAGQQGAGATTCPTCTSPDRTVRLALDWLGTQVCRDEWHVLDEGQASDLGKCDENTLRSENL